MITADIRTISQKKKKNPHQPEMLAVYCYKVHAFVLNVNRYVGLRGGLQFHSNEQGVDLALALIGPKNLFSSQANCVFAVCMRRAGHVGGSRRIHHGLVSRFLSLNQ